MLTSLPVDGLPVIASEEVTNKDDRCIRLLGVFPKRGKTRTTVRGGK